MSGSDDEKNKELSQDVNSSGDRAEFDAQKAREIHVKRRKYILGIACSGIFIALTFISAQISIPITPAVAFTLQFLVTNVCCLLLGKKWGALTIF